jgi:hypothetical protein
MYTLGLLQQNRQRQYSQSGTDLDEWSEENNPGFLAGNSRYS